MINVSHRWKNTIRQEREEMAALFHTSRSNIMEYISHIYEEDELEGNKGAAFL